MGFFSELKEDLSQAVNELVPTEKEELEELTETEEALLEKVETETEELEVKVQEEETEAEETVEVETAVEEAPTPAPPVMGFEISDEIAEGLDEVSTITKNVVINGDLEADGSLELFGTVNGNIKVLGKINVTGKIAGNSEAAEVHAQSAKIVGNITSYGSVVIGRDSVIRGNIYATNAVIAGAVKGDIDVRGPVILDASAIVMGNIKSKSVQINNGAVIEGLCSQCYAEINPSIFFED